MPKYKLKRSWWGWGPITDPEVLLLEGLFDFDNTPRTFRQPLLLNTVTSNTNSSLIQGSQEFNLERGSAHARVIGRTQFTKGSFEAKLTINLHSFLHTASTFLAFMMLKEMKNIRTHGFGLGENAGLVISLSLLLAIWGGAAALNRQANYYKYIERLTGEYDIEWLTLNSNLTLGTLYLFYDDNKLHYLIRVEAETEKKFDTCSQTVLNKAKSLTGEGQKDVYFEIVSLEHISNVLKDELTHLNVDAQNGVKLISPEGASELKEIIAQYPNQLSKENADSKFVPTVDALPNYWFFLLCTLAQLPSASSGFLLGYLMMNSVGAGVVTALFNWMISLINTMPAVGNRYGKENRMGRIEDQPFTSIVLNWFVLGCLKNIIPFGLSLSMLMSLSINSIIPTIKRNSPVTWGLIPGLLLFPHMTSTFLSFILFALKKLDLSIPIALHNDCVDSEYQIGRLSAELLGWRYTTITLPLLLGCSPETVAKQMALGNALGAFGLLFIPSFDVVIAFLEFVAEEAAPLPTAILTLIVLTGALISAILGAKSQKAAYEECAKAHQLELIKNGSLTAAQPNNTASDGSDNNTQVIVRYASQKQTGPLVLIPNPDTASLSKMIYISMTAHHFFNHVIIDDNHKACTKLSNSLEFI